MKLKFKTSNRERWILALAPAFVIGTFYLYGYEARLSAELVAANKRLAAAQAPLASSGPSAALVNAKASLESAKSALSDEQVKVDQLNSRLAKLVSVENGANDSNAAARVIGRIESVFARNGITPLISESAAEGTAGARMPGAIVAILSPKAGAGTTTEHKAVRIWHYVFDDLTVHFQKALADLTRDVPGVVPLSLNFVYNPRNNGETRELELWILY